MRLKTAGSTCSSINPATTLRLSRDRSNLHNLRSNQSCRDRKASVDAHNHLIYVTCKTLPLAGTRDTLRLSRLNRHTTNLEPTTPIRLPLRPLERALSLDSSRHRDEVSAFTNPCKSNHHRIHHVSVSAIPTAETSYVFGPRIPLHRS